MGEGWLAEVAEAFEGIKAGLDGTGEVDLGDYVRALERIPSIFDFLGSVFVFAKKDLTEKIEHLKANADGRGTVREAIRADVEAGRELAGNTKTSPEAVSRPLHRVTNGLKFLNLLLGDMLREGNEDHLRVSAKRAFSGSIEYYLAWAVKKAVAAGLYLLPSRDAFLTKIGETEETARGPAERVVAATTPVLDHVYGIYADLGIDL